MPRFEIIDGQCVIPNGVTEILDEEFSDCRDLNRKFSDGFNALIELNPRRYKAIMIETLESEIESLQKTVQEVKRSLNNDSLKENRGNTEHPDDKQDDSWIDEVLG